MKKIHQEILINAPREKVWKNITTDQPYRQWTAPFMPGSYFEGKWVQGEKIRFLAANQDGSVGGMFSEIAACRQPEFLSIHHLGIIKNGVEDTFSEEAKPWQSAYENYTLEDIDGQTRLIIDVDTDEKYEAMFQKIWPQALQILKEISEK